MRAPSLPAADGGIKPRARARGTGAARENRPIYEPWRATRHDVAPRGQDFLRAGPAHTRGSRPGRYTAVRLRGLRTWVALAVRIPGAHAPGSIPPSAAGGLRPQERPGGLCPGPVCLRAVSPARGGII